MLLVLTICLVAGQAGVSNVFSLMGLVVKLILVLLEYFGWPIHILPTFSSVFVLAIILLLQAAWTMHVSDLSFKVVISQVIIGEILRLLPTWLTT